MTPRLADLIEEWRKTTAFSTWTYTKPVSYVAIHPSGYIWPPSPNKRGLVQVWSDHVFVIIADNIIPLIQECERYKRHINNLFPPGSNQYIRLNAADPEFFSDLGNMMGMIHG